MNHMVWPGARGPHGAAACRYDTGAQPVSKVVVCGTANWCQTADVKTLKIARDKIVYSWHPYPSVYGSIGATTWESKFGL